MPGYISKKKKNIKLKLQLSLSRSSRLGTYLVPGSYIYISTLLVITEHTLPLIGLTSHLALRSSQQPNAPLRNGVTAVPSPHASAHVNECRSGQTSQVEIEIEKILLFCATHIHLIVFCCCCPLELLFFFLTKDLIFFVLPRS